MASFGQAGQRRSPESPWAIRNHLWIVVALGEERQADLTPQPSWHNHDDYRAGPIAKAERSADNLVKLVEKGQLDAVTSAKSRVPDQEITILVRRWEHHDIVYLPADVVIEALCLIGRDPVF